MLKDYQKRLKELNQREMELIFEYDNLYKELEDKEQEKEIQLEECKIQEQREVIRDEINYINCLKEVVDNALFYDDEPYEELEERWGEVE